MTHAMSSASVDPAVPKSDVLVVLLEGIHSSAIDALRRDGYARIVTHAKSLAGADLGAHCQRSCADSGMALTDYRSNSTSH